MWRVEQEVPFCFVAKLPPSKSEAACSQFVRLQVFPLLVEELKNKIKRTRRSQFLFLTSNNTAWNLYLMDEYIPHRLLMWRDLTWVMKQETQSKHRGKETVYLAQSQMPPNYCLHFRQSTEKVASFSLRISVHFITNQEEEHFSEAFLIEGL